MATSKTPVAKQKAPATKAAPAKATAKKAAPAKATSKKAAPAGNGAGRRMVEKVSPLAGMEIEAYVAAKAHGWQADALRTLLAIVAESAPEATVAIKWGQPVIAQNGPMMFVKPNKAHVTFGFWRGGEMKDPTGVLEGSGDKMRHLKLASTAEIRKDVLVPLVKQAVALNREKGDPSKRKG